MEAAIAVALTGMPQPPLLPPCGAKPLVPPTLKERTAPLPNLPPATRVSRMRHGLMATYTVSERDGGCAEKFWRDGSSPATTVGR